MAAPAEKTITDLNGKWVYVSILSAGSFFSSGRRQALFLPTLSRSPRTDNPECDRGELGMKSSELLGRLVLGLQALSFYVPWLVRYTVMRRNEQLARELQRPIKRIIAPKPVGTFWLPVHK